MRLVRLCSTIIVSNLSWYVAASTFLGLAIALFSIPKAGVELVSDVMRQGGVIPFLLNSLSQTLATPLAFLIVVLPSMVTEFLGSMKKGSAIVTLLPVSRGDIAASAYFITLIAGLSAATIASYINTVLTYFVTGLQVPPNYLLISVAAYLATFVPTMLFATSLALLLYSSTPIKSGIPWILMVLYLVAIPLALLLASSATHSEVASKIVLSALSPSYGFLELLRYLLEDSTHTLSALCFGISMASLVSVTILAIAMFRAYGEVVL